MTIQSVNEMWSRRSGTWSSDENAKKTLDYAGAYQVVHDPGEDLNAILFADGLPRPGEPRAGTDFVFCRTVGPVQAVGPIMSVVPVTWSGDTGPSGPSDNPLNARPIIRRYNAKTMEPVDVDGWGQPLTNTVGDPVKGLTKPVSDFVLTVQRNFANVDTYTLAQYLDSVSSDTFDGWPPGTSRLDAYTAEEKFDNNVGYYQVDATIYRRIPYQTSPARAWWHRYVNEGLYCRNGVNITFTGGGAPAGAEAKGYAVTNNAGAVISVVVTDNGRGYTSAPSVVFSSDSGSGAAATAVLDEDFVDYVNLTNGGTGYKGVCVRAIDDRKEPVTSPVLLAANGTRLPDSSNAVWIERPAQSNVLPYNFLGLL